MHSHFQKWRERKKKTQLSHPRSILKKTGREFKVCLKRRERKKWKSKFQTEVCLGEMAFCGRLLSAAAVMWLRFVTFLCASRAAICQHSEWRRHKRGAGVMHSEGSAENERERPPEWRATTEFTHLESRERNPSIRCVFTHKALFKVSLLPPQVPLLSHPPLLSDHLITESNHFHLFTLLVLVF